MSASNNDRTAIEQPESAARKGAAAPAAMQGRLGKYALLELVGAGSFGVVYKSFDPESQRELAIKVIPLNVWPATGARSLAQLRIGLEQSMSFSHPGLVPIRACGEEAGFAYIAMDWVIGRSLRDRFEQPAHFRIEQVIDLLSQLLQALQYVHDRGQCHGDLSAANVLITHNGRVRLKGCGLIRPATLLGTPGYIAPETYSSGAADSRSEVYAAGAMFYGLLTGALPFAGTADEIRRQVCRDAPLPPSRATGLASLRPFDALALHALARDPEQRLPSASQFLESLLRAYVYADGPDEAADKTLASQSPSDAVLTTLLNLPPVVDVAPVAVVDVAPVAQVVRVTESVEPTRVIGRPPIEPVEFVIAPMRQAAAAPARESPPAAGSTPASNVHGGTLAQIQQRLLQLLGPIAAIVVRRAMRETKDLGSLTAWLAARIDPVSDRDKFLGDVSRMGRPPSSPIADVSSAAGVAPDTTRRNYGSDGVAARPPTGEDIARASQLLLAHLGPIAPVLAKRTAQQPGCTREQFIAALAGHIEDERQRAHFLAALG